LAVESVADWMDRRRREVEAFGREGARRVGQGRQGRPGFGCGATERCHGVGRPPAGREGTRTGKVEGGSRLSESQARRPASA